MTHILFLVLAAVFPALSMADEARPLADNPEVEARLRGLAVELRCLVCQNLAGSQADLAKDLREEVRGLLKQGKSDREIKDFLVSRYGDFVLYRPPVKPTTYLLWIGPFLLLLGGLYALIHFLKGRKREAAETPLSDAEKQRVEALLKDGQP